MTLKIKLLIITLFVIILGSCSNNKLEIIKKTLEIGNYSSINNNQLIFIDGSTFAILDSSLDATIKGKYYIHKLIFNKYKISLYANNSIFYFIIKIDPINNYIILPDSITLYNKTYYCTDDLLR